MWHSVQQQLGRGGFEHLGERGISAGSDKLTSTDRRLPTLQRLCFGVVTVGLSLMGGELLLQATAGVSSRIRGAITAPHLLQQSASSPVRPLMSDAHVGHRGNPAYPLHDRQGYRNPVVPAAVDVVVIGDSQTYGPGVSSDEVWPIVLERSLDLSTYNMGIPGWGPLEYVSVMDEALALQPDVVVIGLYLGNDLFDSFRTVYTYERQTAFGVAEDKEPLMSIERQGRLVDEAARLLSTSTGEGATDHDDGAIHRVRTLLSEHSSLYGAARWAKDRSAQYVIPDHIARERADRAWQAQVNWTHRHPTRGLAVERRGVRTILTPGLRSLALDLTDPRIEEAWNIAQRALRRCLRACSDAQTAFAVVLIPTKEAVFHRFAGQDVSAPVLDRLAAQEAAVRSRLGAFLEGAGIAWVDALDALCSQMERGSSPYPISRDGHPNAIGHQAVAHAASLLFTEQRLNDKCLPVAP